MKFPPVAILGLGLWALAGSVAGLSIEQPARTVGYVIGDMLEQRIKLVAADGPVELAEYPALGRVGPWLQRRSAEKTYDQLNQTWLLLRYQVINTPDNPVVADLPALSLNLTAGAPLTIAAWPIGISPLTPADAVDQQRFAPMRADHQLMAADSRPAKRRLLWSALALAAILLLWLGWWVWRQRMDSRRLPFARAFYQLRTLDGAELDENPEAWRALHRAFDRAAGRSIHRSLVIELIREQPWLGTMQTRIEAFYAASATRFFASSAQPLPFALAEFCRHLYLAEKQHAVGVRSMHR